MEINKLNESLSKLLEANPDFQESLYIAKKNFLGEVWLIGSGVYKNLINLLNNQNLKINDWDFIGEHRKMYEDLYLPEGYSLSHSRFGGIKLTGRMNIDLINLEHYFPSAINFVEPTIDNYLRHASLNIQSIAYDPAKKKILGDWGIESILKREIKVVNQTSAIFSSRMTHKPIFDMVNEKAKELNFKPVYG